MQTSQTQPAVAPNERADVPAEHEGESIGVPGLERGGAGEAGGGDAGLLGAGDLLLMFGVMALCFVALRSWRRRMRRLGDAPATPEEVVRLAVPTTGPGAELDRRSAEAARLVRELSATLDTKAARLEVLIAQADERLAKLEAKDQDEAA